MRTHWRFAIAVILLAGAAIILQARNGSEIIPARAPLESFPRTIDGWNSSDVELTQDVRDVLGPGDFLLRDYRDPQNFQDVFLFVAYFPSQRMNNATNSAEGR